MPADAAVLGAVPARSPVFAIVKVRTVQEFVKLQTAGARIQLEDAISALQYDPSPPDSRPYPDSPEAFGLMMLPVKAHKLYLIYSIEREKEKITLIAIQPYIIEATQ
jgi:hypothetical protein